MDKSKPVILGGDYESKNEIFRYKVWLVLNSIADFYIGKKIFNLQKYDELCKSKGIESHSNLLKECVFSQILKI